VTGFQRATPQLWGEQFTFFQLLYRCRNFLLKIEHQRGSFLVILKRGAQRFICKGFQSSEDRMVSATTEARYAFITDTEGDQGSLVEVEHELRLGTRGIFIYQTTVNANDLQ
jgi:hypothetical protein